MMFLNFQRLFGGFGSQLDPILEKFDCSLEMILDEDLLIELRNSGANKFGTFVTKNVDTFERVLEYLLPQHEEHINQKKQIRYPFMLSEVFASENSQMIDYFFEPDKNVQEWEAHEEKRVTFLPRLFEFLDADYLNVTSAGYFAKVVGAIIRRRGFDIWTFINAHPQILANLIKHSDVQHIAEITEKLIVLETSQDPLDNEFLAERTKLLLRVISYLENKTHQQEIVDNCCNILNEVTNKTECFFNTLHQPSKLFSIGLNSGSSQVISLIINIIDQLQRYIKQEAEKGITIEFDYSKYVQICVELPRALQAQKIQLSSFQTTYGDNQNPFSQVKLKLVQLAFTLLKLQNELIYQTFQIDQFYKYLLEQVIRYEFNNQLQNLFYDITIFIFENQSCVDYRLQLTESGFFNFLAEKNKLEKKSVGQLQKPIRSGYCGVLSKLSYQLEKYAPADNEAWSQYRNNILSPLKQVEQVFMFGINPNPRQQLQQQEEDEESMRLIFQKIESHRQTQSQLNQENVEPEEENDDNQQIEVGDDKEEEEEIQAKKTLKLNEEALEEKISEVILSPKTSPKEVQQIIQFQEQNTKLSPQDIDTKSDSTVNKYWKSHEHQEEHHIQRRASSDENSVNKEKQAVEEQQVEEHIPEPENEEIEEDIHQSGESTEEVGVQQEQEKQEIQQEKQQEQKQEAQQEQQQEELQEQQEQEKAEEKQEEKILQEEVADKNKEIGEKAEQQEEKELEQKKEEAQ